MFAQGSHAGMPAGPTAAVTLLPVAGAACGVALRATLTTGSGLELRHRRRGDVWLQDL